MQVGSVGQKPPSGSRSTKPSTCRRERASRIGVRDTPSSAGQALLAEPVPEREVAGQQPLLQLAVGLLRPG